MTAEELASRIIAELKADDDYDAPYVGQGFDGRVVIDGAVDLRALAAKILEWVNA